MDKKQKKRLAIKKLSKDRQVSLTVAAHIYACMSSKQQRACREAVVGVQPTYKVKEEYLGG